MRCHPAEGGSPERSEGKRYRDKLDTIERVWLLGLDSSTFGQSEGLDDVIWRQPVETKTTKWFWLLGLDSNQQPSG